jgi:hypothetical protein
MSQAQLQRAHVFLPSGSAPVQAPPFGLGSSEPQYVLSPTAPATGHKTIGFVFMVACDTVLNLTVWMRDPHTQFWGKLVILTSAAPGGIAAFKWVTVCEALATEVWIQTDAQSVDPHPAPAIVIMEISG